MLTSDSEPAVPGASCIGTGPLPCKPGRRRSPRHCCPGSLAGGRTPRCTELSRQRMRTWTWAEVATGALHRWRNPPRSRTRSARHRPETCESRDPRGTEWRRPEPIHSGGDPRRTETRPAGEVGWMPLASPASGLGPLHTRCGLREAWCSEAWSVSGCCCCCCCCRCEGWLHTSCLCLARYWRSWRRCRLTKSSCFCTWNWQSTRQKKKRQKKN